MTNTCTVTSVFHKIGNFNFSVTLLTFPENAMLHKMGIHTFGSQVMKYAKICCAFNDFSKTNRTFRLLLSTGYDGTELRLIASNFSKE